MGGTYGLMVSSDHPVAVQCPPGGNVQITVQSGGPVSYSDDRAFGAGALGTISAGSTKSFDVQTYIIGTAGSVAAVTVVAVDPPGPPTGSVDITKEFGVSPAVTDNSTPLNTALQALGSVGMDAWLPTPGGLATLPIQNPVVIGTGTGSAQSTWSCKLQGGGYANYKNMAHVAATSGVQLSWTGLAGATAMVEVLGPLSGWGLERLLVNGNGGSNAPNYGLLVQSAQNGSVRNFATINCQFGIHVTAVPKFGILSTNTMSNVWDNIMLHWIGAASGGPNSYSPGLFFDGVSGGGNACYEDYRGVQLVTPSSSAGFTFAHIYFGACDNVYLENVHMADAGGSDTKLRVVYDYSVNNTWPADCCIDRIDFGTSTSGLIVNVGTPGAGATPNRIVAVSKTNGQPANPTLTNLDWGYSNASP